MNMDVLIINLPKMEPYYFPAAPAILKGGCNYLDLSSKVIDFNLHYVECCARNNLQWRTATTNIETESIEIQNIFVEEIKTWAQTICSHNPKLLAVSIFSYYGHFFARELLKELKKINFKGQIILGGSGISDAMNEKPIFAMEMINLQLASAMIGGDSEAAWIAFLLEYFNIIKPPEPEYTLNTPYISDFSDYDTAKYEKWKHGEYKVTIPVTGSRGCVRKCTFCEIHRHWKFDQRSATHILTEIEQLIELVEDPHIHFTDSLLNGNLVEFTDIITGLAKFKSSGKKFSWGGQFIIRSQKQFPEKYWKILGDTNCQNLEIGVETGSDKLRYEMKKNFSNDDLDYSLEMMKKYNITCIFLLFIGYPTETAEQFAETFKMFEKYQKYANNVIEMVELNFSMAVEKNTPLYDIRDTLGIKTTWDPVLWFCTTNPTLTFKERVRRRLVLQEHIEKLGFTPSFNKKVQLLEIFKNYKVYKRAVNIINRN